MAARIAFTVGGDGGGGVKGEALSIKSYRAVKGEGCTVSDEDIIVGIGSRLPCGVSRYGEVLGKRGFGKDEKEKSEKAEGNYFFQWVSLDILLNAWL